MPGIWFQLEAFFYTMILGLFAALILHYYQTLIKKAKAAKLFLYLLDLLFWVMMVMLVFLGMLYINQGEMRSYVLIALIVGGIIYFRILSRSCTALVSKLADITLAISRLLFKGVYCFPRDILYRIKRIVIIPRLKKEEEDEEKEK
ncbi:MAG: spore cortex biosynthesis protein YabQ [Syntrophomonadaceae bacterium]|nr:hypothetical protein [Syntrophomonadaceae bacterium]